MFLVKVFIFVLNIIYFFVKFFPIKNKVTFISRQSNSKSIDFVLISKEILKQDKNIKQVFLCKKLEIGIFNKIIYFFHMFRQMYHLSTSKVIVLDSYCITASVLKKKKNTIIIQMWHALGAFKKFGYSILDQEEGSKKQFALTMKMHNNYDYVFTSSEYCKKYFSQAFNTDIEKFVVMPLPRVDLLTSDDIIKKTREKVFERYPTLKRKKNIVYAPTFRKGKEKPNMIYELIESIDYSKYNLIIKTHPLSKMTIKDDRVITDRKFSTIDIIMASDYVITDYSAILFEACLLKKPIYFYCYDFKDYFRKRDFYLDYKKDMPGPIEEEPVSLFRLIKKDNYNMSSIDDFTKKYISYEKGKSSYNIASFIIDKIYNK